MPWVRVDDHFDEHVKFARVGPLGIALWVTGLAYCNRNLTDGFIPWAVARRLLAWEFLGPETDDERGRIVYQIAVTSGHSGDDVGCPFVIDLLLDAGLWEIVEGGYRVHDYADYQPSREDTIAHRDELSAIRALAGRAGGINSGKTRRARSPLLKEANAKQTGSKDEANAPAKAEQNGSPGPGPGIPLLTNVSSGESASHDAAASAAPVSFLDRYIGRLQSEKKNRPGILGAAYAELFGACAHDQYGRIELLAKASGAAETLKAMIKAAAQVEAKADDPIAYMAGILKPKNGTGETARLVERFAPAGDGPNALDLYNAREARKKAEREGRADE